MADTTYATRTVSAMFDSQDEAQRAAERLRAAGIPDASIRMTQGSGSDGTSSSGTGYADQQKGFWENLGDFFFPDEDRYTYAEGLARGSVLLTVTDFDEAHHDTVVDILDDHGSVDLDSRENEWRSSGWTDYRGSSYYNESDDSRGAGLTPAAAGMGAAAMAASGGLSSRGTVYDDGMTGSDRDAGIGSTTAGAVGGTTGLSGSDYGSAGMTGAAATRGDDERDYDRTAGLGAVGTSTDVSGDDTVKVVEERLAVGKREAEGGRVRVRSYVREQPVSADVQLSSTRVFVERRPVDRAVGAGDVSFQDRTIEAREHIEEAVVGKEARVVEEIGLRQESETHTETVSDTVRRTEVEIEDERTGEVTRVTGDDSTTGSGTGRL